ncbi:unnamed protein product, partial [Ceratitis capitata]
SSQKTSPEISALRKYEWETREAVYYVSGANMVSTNELRYTHKEKNGDDVAFIASTSDAIPAPYTDVWIADSGVCPCKQQMDTSCSHERTICTPATVKPTLYCFSNNKRVLDVDRIPILYVDRQN